MQTRTLAAVERPTLTVAQYTAALALAAHYGHQWGAACSRDYPVGDERRQTLAPTWARIDRELTAGAVTLETIEEASLALGYGPCGGIGSPTLEERSSEFGVARIVTHRTGSGRLSWTIGADGRTEIWVTRPNPDELTMRAHCSGSTEPGPCRCDGCRQIDATVDRLYETALRTLGSVQAEQAGDAEAARIQYEPAIPTYRRRGVVAAYIATLPTSIGILRAVSPAEGPPSVGHCGLPFFARHVWALEEAMRALDAARWDVFGPLWALSPDRAEWVAEIRGYAPESPDAARIEAYQ